VFSPTFTEPLFQVPATGGKPSPVTKLSDNYTTHRWPWFLPDGRHFLYLAANHAATTSPNTSIFWASLDGKDIKPLLTSPSNAIYVSGHLLYVRDNTLMAQQFDPSSGQLQGEAVPLNGDVQVDGSVWRGTFSASDTGTLIYQPGAAIAGNRLTWFDRSGKEIGIVSGPDAYSLMELSPDDKKAALTVGDPVGVIWMYDLVHNGRTRFTFGNDSNVNPIWSRDGKRIAYLTGSLNSAYSRKVIVKAADGSGGAKELGDIGTSHTIQGQLDDWSTDGRYILYESGTTAEGSGIDLWLLPLSGEKPFPFIAGPGDQQFGQFSSDGRWVAYDSSETGTSDVYVAPFPATGAKWHAAAVAARWERNRVRGSG